MTQYGFTEVNFAGTDDAAREYSQSIWRNSSAGLSGPTTNQSCLRSGEAKQNSSPFARPLKSLGGLPLRSVSRSSTNQRSKRLEAVQRFVVLN
jgi:hypothetical protein